MTATLNRYGLAAEVVSAPVMLCRCLHSAEAAPGGLGRGVARASLEPGNVPGLFQYELHIGRAGAYILSGDVFPGKGFDQLPVSAKQLFAAERGAIVQSVVSQDNRLATAARQSG